MPLGFEIDILTFMFSRTLIFVFDFLSPYSYQAWTWLRENRNFLTQQGYQIEFKPVVMSKVIKSHDTKGPAEIESKRNFLFKDCLRWASLQGIPFRVPSRLPFNSLEALRISCLEDRQSDYVDFFFRMAWEKGVALDDDAEIGKALEREGFDQFQLIELASSKEMRKKLRENTQWAIQQELFGVPVFWLEEEGVLLDWFWGRDSISQLKLFIENKDPLDFLEYKRYLALFESDF